MLNAWAAAKQWLLFSQSNTDPKRTPQFFQFVSTWIGFNALYSTDRKRGNPEPIVVSQFAFEQLERHHLHLLESDQEYIQALEYLQIRPVKNMRTGKPVEITDRKDIHQVADCLYAVRCNLFHGDKDPGELRDQTVVDRASVVLSHLLTAYLGSR